MISGHTDNRPIATPRFPSNWELSTARAIAVAHFLMQGIGLDKSRIIVAGHADTRPLVRNDTADKRAKNRRVEIRVIRKDTAN
jgi:chemotaxis protein MotB